MYKLSVPIMSSTVTPENRARYVQQLKRSKTDRVFFCSPTASQTDVRQIAENVSYFKAQGFEVGIWLGDTIGHGLILKHREDSDNTSMFSPIVDITGEVRHGTNCPLDGNFRRYIADLVAELALTGADPIMLDDDFRMSQHGEEFCCACPLHIARISELCGEALSREDLKRLVFSGKKNKYRSAWLAAQNEGLTRMAKDIRAKVDEASPDVTVCFCTAYSPWNVDGTDVWEIAKILAGKNQPILRLTGAPYWAVKARTFPLISVFEIARMLASFCRDKGIELMSEGDVYPRPRYTCPASYLELYDAVTRLDSGYDGILKYMFDYVAGPDFETGYLDFHEKHTAVREQLVSLFGAGANAGVRIVAHPHTMEGADLDLASLSLHSPLPADGAMFGMCGIPTIYSGEGFCNAVFGENARYLDAHELERGTVIDAVSAVILTERGVDVGLASIGELAKKEISFLATDDPAFKSFIANGSARILSAALRAGAEPLLYAVNGRDAEPVAYRYENADGERFLVFLFEGDSLQKTSSIPKNYAIQRVLIENLPWTARQPIPAYCAKNPELYVMCAKEDGALSVALFNCFADSLNNPVIELDGEYSRIACVGCSAALDGSRVILTSELHAFSYAAFRVYK